MPYKRKCLSCKKMFLRPNRRRFKCGVCKGTSYPTICSKLKDIIIPKSKCLICGMTNKRSIKLFGKSLHLHHVDGNRMNNSMSNLTVKCIQCHMGEHKKGKTLKVLLGQFGNKRLYWRDFLDKGFWQSRFRSARG